MKKLIIFLSLVLLSISACAMGFGRIYYSPGISFLNLSSQNINNIECNWVGEELVTPSRLKPGITASQGFPLRNIKDFYGTVHLTWQNSSGKKFEKTFEFTENDFPLSAFQDYEEFNKMINAKKTDYSDPRSAFYVQFEFTQDGVEMYTSSTPGAKEKLMRAGKIKQQLKKAHYN